MHRGQLGLVGRTRLQQESVPCLNPISPKYELCDFPGSVSSLRLGTVITPISLGVGTGMRGPKLRVKLESSDS